MPLSELLGVGVLGVGSHARRNTLPALAAAEGVRLVGLFTRDEQVREAEAQRHGCRAFSSEADLLASPEVAAVYVALPIGLHAAAGLRVLGAGRHLLCEKTLAASRAEAEALVTAAAARDLLLAECYMFVHHPQFERLRACTTGELGQVRSVSGRFGFPHLAPTDHRYVPVLGGGAFLDLAGYPLRAARGLIGEEPEIVHAHLETDSGRAVDTGGSAFLRFPSGAHALLEWGFGRAYRSELELWGDQGWARSERAFTKPPDLETRVRIWRQSGATLDEPIAAANHFTRMFAELAGACRTPEGRASSRDEVARQARALWTISEAAAVRGG